MTRRLIAWTACLLALSLCGAPAGSALPSRDQGRCPVTIPTRKVPVDAGFSAAGFNHGNGRLRAQLYWPRGVVAAGTLPAGGSMAVVNPDGSIYLKLGWWRGTTGNLVIRGRRLDGSAPPLRSSVTTAPTGLAGFHPERAHVPDRRLLAGRRQGRESKPHVRRSGDQAALTAELARGLASAVPVAAPQAPRRQQAAVQDGGRG